MHSFTKTIDHVSLRFDEVIWLDEVGQDLGLGEVLMPRLNEVYSSPGTGQCFQYFIQSCLLLASDKPQS